MIGIDGHVSFLPQKKKKKKKKRLIAPNLILYAPACGGRCCAERARGRRIIILDQILHRLLYLFWGFWEKAYMPIDANHIGNLKDR